MSINDKLTKQAKLRIFFDNMRPKVINLLCKKYGLREDEAADCFQEGAIAMWKNLKEGKITLQTINSLDSYLFRCCCNHASKAVLSQKRTTLVDDLAEFEGKADNHNEDYHDKERQIRILISLVKQLDEPCHSIIWGYYRHNYSMEDMAAMLNYKNADVVKSLKNRCMSKLKNFAHNRGLTNQQYE